MTIISDDNADLAWRKKKFLEKGIYVSLFKKKQLCFMHGHTSEDFYSLYWDNILLRFDYYSDKKVLIVFNKWDFIVQYVTLCNIFWYCV